MNVTMVQFFVLCVPIYPDRRVMNKEDLSFCPENFFLNPNITQSNIILYLTVLTTLQSITFLHGEITINIKLKTKSLIILIFPF